MVAFAHATLFPPALLTLEKALTNSYITNLPGLTAQYLSKHPLNTCPQPKATCIRRIWINVLINRAQFINLMAMNPSMATIILHRLPTLIKPSNINSGLANLLDRYIHTRLDVWYLHPALSTTISWSCMTTTEITFLHNWWKNDKPPIFSMPTKLYTHAYTTLDWILLFNESTTNDLPY